MMAGNRWLARLKNERAPEAEPRKPRQPDAEGAAGGFLGFLGAGSGEQPKTQAAEPDGFLVGGSAAEPNAPAGDPAANDAGAPVLPHSHARAHLSDAEVEAFAARLERFTKRGLSLDAAEALAERLAIRDAEGDDRRMCLECSYLGALGRCIAAATGRLPGASRQLEPVQTILQRCEAFGLCKGLT